MKIGITDFVFIVVVILLTGSAVEQVATVFAALSDAKETTRELVVSLVERLAGRLESMEAENRRLRKDNMTLHQQISKDARSAPPPDKDPQKDVSPDDSTPVNDVPTEGKPMEKEPAVSPSPKLPSALEPKTDLVPPHVSVVRSSPVSVITSQASIKMEPLSE